MNRLSLMLIVPVLALAACTGDRNEDDRGLVARASEKVRQEIREEMATENLSLGKGRNGEPRAELSPQGDLVIDGETVPLDEAQRGMVLAYRGHIAAIAESGADVGLQSAELAKDAVSSALKAAVRGEDPAAVEDAMKAKAGEIEASAKALCDRLPALYAAQQELAAAVPEFAPYARMDESDVDECRVKP